MDTRRDGAHIFRLPGQGWFLECSEGLRGPFPLRTQAELELERVRRLSEIRATSPIAAGGNIPADPARSPTTESDSTLRPQDVKDA